MNDREMLEAVGQCQRDLNQATTLLSQVSTKLAAVASQMLVNLRQQPEGPAAEAPAAAPAIPVPNSLRTQSVTSPTATGDQPLDLSFASERRGEPRGAVKEVMPPLPPRNTPGAPTEEAPAAPATPSAETPADERQRLDAQRLQEQLGHFMGTGSLAARFLSPVVIAGGKGFLKPGVGNLKQFSDDPMRLAPVRMHEWPTGFYRDHATSRQVFMLNLRSAVVVWRALPDGEPEPLVSLRSEQGITDLMLVSQLKLIDLLIVKESVEAELTRLSAAVPA